MEATSFGQMENILSCGCYTVGRESDVLIESINDAISLKLMLQPGKKLQRKSYSLDELRDLEVRIVLITGSRAENKEAVKKFLDVRKYYC